MKRVFKGHGKAVYGFAVCKTYKVPLPASGHRQLRRLFAALLQFVASCGQERAVLIWDAYTLQVTNRLTGHQASVHDVLRS